MPDTLDTALREPLVACTIATPAVVGLVAVRLALVRIPGSGTPIRTWLVMLPVILGTLWAGELGLGPLPWTVLVMVVSIPAFREFARVTGLDAEALFVEPGRRSLAGEGRPAAMARARRLPAGSVGAPSAYPRAMRVAQGLERVHEDIINLYLVVDGGKVTVVDTGFPGNWGLLRAGLARLSRTLADVEVILLTHAHQDHVWMAERLRRPSGAPVRIHEDDLPYLPAGKRPPGKAAGGLSRRLLGVLACAVRMGGFRMPPVAEAATFEDGEILDVPGRPRVVHTPGHTDGHCSLHLAERGVLLAGDAIVTISPTTGRRGPQLSPYYADLGQARASLDRIERLPGRLVLPGHGEPFAGTPAEAVALARAAEVR